MPKNNSIVDVWSFIHLVTSAILAYLFGPLIALLIVMLWEPIELFILSPFLAKRGVVFGNEGWRNVLSDIIVNIVGVAIIFLLGIRFSDFNNLNFNWGAEDVVAAFILLGLGIASYYGASTLTKNHIIKRIITFISVLLIILLWMELSVGIFNTPFAGT